MITVTEMRKVFADKLAITDSFDAAFAKVIWVSYKAGVADAAVKPLEIDNGTDREQTI